LSHGEFRESVDIDFLVSDVASYRNLRQLLTNPGGIAAITREGAGPLRQAHDVRAMAMTIPKAQLWQRVRALRRVLA
jgi:hypothetical protein